jgi:DtxR family transcriptional regulator, manganese transport regulator
MGVAHPTASKTIARLKREGLVRAKPYRGIFLTEAGAAMAKSARERHRLVVDLLIAIGAPREAAEADAEGIEHYVSASTLRAFEAFLRGRGEA